MRGNNFLSRAAWALIILGAIFCYLGVQDFIRGSKTPVDFNSMLEADVKKGMIVEGDVYSNFGAFEENYTTKNGVKTGNSNYNYMIPVGEKQYMGLMNHSTAMEQELEDQADKTYDYLSGATATEPVPVHFKGRIMKMKNETREYMHDYMISMGFTEDETNDYILEYYIKSETYDGWWWELLFGAGALCIGLAIIVIPILLSRRKNDVIFANSSNTYENDIVPDNMGSQETAASSDDFFQSSIRYENNSPKMEPEKEPLESGLRLKDE